MLKLRALEHDGGQLRLRCLKHRLRLSHVEIGNRSARAQVASQLERFGEDLDAGVEDRPLSVQRSQGEIVHSHFGLDHQFDGFEIIRAGLCQRSGGFHAAADSTPEIHLVAEGQGHIKIVERGAGPLGFSGGRGRSVC